MTHFRHSVAFLPLSLLGLMATLAAADAAFIHVEAETADVVREPLVLRSGAEATGGQFLYADPMLWQASDRHVAFTASGQGGDGRPTTLPGGLGLAEYRVRLPHAGRWHTWFRCWFANSGDDSFFLRIDDTEWGRIAEDKYADWRWIQGPVLDLAAGVHRVQVSGREDNSVLDAFQFRDDAEPTPAPELHRLSGVEAFTVPVPAQPGVTAEGVTYLNHFDEPTGAAAAHARGDARTGGMHYELGQPGRFGAGVLLSHPKSYLLVQGQGNASSDDVTLDFWCRTDAEAVGPADARKRYLLTVQFEWQMLVVQGPVSEVRQRGNDRLALYLEAQRHALCLELRQHVSRGVPTTFIEIEPADVAADGWQHVLVSWQKRTGRFWLALDGRGKTRATQDWRFEPVLGIFLGSADYYKTLLPLGGVLDEVRIRDRAVPNLEGQP